MLKSSNEAYCFQTDQSLRVVSWDDGLSRLFGTPRSEVIGKEYHRFLPRIIVKEKDALETALSEGRTIDLPGYRFSCFYFSATADLIVAPVGNANGSAPQVEVAFRFFSFCPELQKAEYLRQLVDMGKIAANLAHGVRNPLNSIKGASTFLAERFTHEPVVKEFTGIIEQEICKLDSFIARFMSASIPGIHCPTADVNSVIRKVDIMTSMRLRTAGIKSSYEFGQVRRTALPPLQLEQALLNVVNTSLQMMPVGGRMTVKTFEAVSGDKEYVVAEVADTGVGIGGAWRDTYGPHAVSDASETQGLFLTREILIANNGHMEIESSPGAGSTVRLFLPVCEEDTL